MHNLLYSHQFGVSFIVCRIQKENMAAWLTLLECPSCNQYIYYVICYRIEISSILCHLKLFVLKLHQFKFDTSFLILDPTVRIHQFFNLERTYKIKIIEYAPILIFPIDNKMIYIKKSFFKKSNEKIKFKGWID